MMRTIATAVLVLATASHALAQVSFVPFEGLAEDIRAAAKTTPRQSSHILHMEIPFQSQPARRQTCEPRRAGHRVAFSSSVAELRERLV